MFYYYDVIIIKWKKQAKQWITSKSGQKKRNKMPHILELYGFVNLLILIQFQQGITKVRL